MFFGDSGRSRSQFLPWFQELSWPRATAGLLTGRSRPESTFRASGLLDDRTRRRQRLGHLLQLDQIAAAVAGEAALAVEADAEGVLALHLAAGAGALHRDEPARLGGPEHG